MRLTDQQIALLRAIHDNKVADRKHHRAGWATRRMDRTSRGRGGRLGIKVTAAAHRLRVLGLAEPQPTPDDLPPLADRLWRLTAKGKRALREIEGGDIP